MRDAISNIPDPCTQAARNEGCICTMPFVHSAQIDPPEPRVHKDCPLHGWAPDPDDARQQRIDDEMMFGTDEERCDD